MTNNIVRILGLTVLVVSCSRSDAAARDTGSKSGAPAVAGAPVTPAGKSSAQDTISDRADRGRVMGDSAAPLWVIMASDFQCPFCKQWHDADFQRIVDKYVTTGRVRLAFLNMPLAMHQHAVEAAEAAMCASVQNKFWPMHETLFKNQQSWESLPNASPTFASLAASTGVNMATWQKCVTDHLTLPMIQADRERVVAAHVNSTPTFFVGDQLLAGADAKLEQAIDAALAKASSSKKPGN